MADGTRAGRELTDTRDRLAFAQDLSDTRRYGVLRELLGLNHFRLGEEAEALRCTEPALAECRAAGDHAGERIHEASLAEIRRAR